VVPAAASVTSFVIKKEQELAEQHRSVGNLVRGAVQALHYPMAEKHYQKALKIHRRLAQRDKSTNTGIQEFFSILTLEDLGQLYKFWNRWDDALEVFQEALESLRRNMRSHGSNPASLDSLAGILLSQGNIYNRQYNSQGRGPDKAKCLAAKALVEEALAIHRTASLQTDEFSLEFGPSTQNHYPLMLLELGSIYTSLELFDKARPTLKEALDLLSRRFGKESVETVTCHTYMTNLCHLHTMALVTSMSQGSACHAGMLQSSACALGSRVLVEGLTSKPEYNGLEGCVFKTVKDSRIGVCLDEGNRKMSLNLVNVRPLLATAPLLVTVEQRKELYKQIQDLTTERIASCKEGLRIQLKMKGVKHLNTAIAYDNLGQSYLMTYRLAETREAVDMHKKADRIMHRIAGDDDPYLREFAQHLHKARLHCDQFEKAGVLSAMPCWRPPTSRHCDREAMAALFQEIQRAGVNTATHCSGLQHRGSSCPRISSEAMQQGLRLYGLFKFTSSSPDPVDVTAFVALACDELQKMKLEANCDSAPVL